MVQGLTVAHGSHVALTIAGEREVCQKENMMRERDHREELRSAIPLDREREYIVGFHPKEQDVLIEGVHSKYGEDMVRLTPAQARMLLGWLEQHIARE